MTMSAATMTIAGESVQSARGFDVIDPATGAPFAQAPDGSAEDVQRAMESAHAAFAAWRRELSVRRKALSAAADAIQANVESIARLLSQEQGKPLRFAKLEVAGAANTFRYNAGLEIPVDVVRKDDAVRIEVHRRPLGVVAAITPWNYPILIAASKVAAALLAGNTVVLKPSPYTPLSSLLLGSVLRDVLPPGVLNVVSGGDEVGRLVSSHPLVRKISFTGSVPTGKKIASVAASDLKRTTLELGGNDPAIVLDDVDPRKAARELFWGAFTNSGQVCTAIKRLYVHEAVYDAVLESLCEVVRAARVGPGLLPDVDLGPVNNAPQCRHVEALRADAEARGGRVVVGGRREGPGYFFDPMLVTGLPDDARLVAEEQFGPILPVLRFSDVDEALARANDTPFGLSGSVWTSDVARGEAVAAQLDCGTAWINQHIALTPLAPFGGSKQSGIGYVNGRWGLDAFCQLQVLNVRLPAST